jgi:hypothetical protein
MAIVLNDPISDFFKIPLVQIAIHVSIVASLVVISNQFWKNYQEKIEITELLEENKALSDANNRLKVQTYYFSSDIYAEKSAKETEWKGKGEIVVDTSSIEPVKLEESNNYIPKNEPSKKSNPEKWLEFLFAKNTE